MLIEQLKKINQDILDWLKFSPKKSTAMNNFRVISFEGTTDGTDLTLNTSIDFLKKKTLTIKRIKLDFYSPDGTPIVNAIQSTTYPAYAPGTYLISPDKGLLLPFFVSNYDAGLVVQLKLNGSIQSFFENSTNGMTTDLDLDNLFIKYPATLQSLSCSVTLSLPEDFTAGVITTTNVWVKVTMEVYLDYPF